MNAAPCQQRQLRLAARALARHGLAHAYGHCSVRLDEHHFLVCASRPMGLILPGQNGVVVPVTGTLPDSVLGEVRLHQQIYRRHPKFNAVTRTMPPLLMTLGTARLTPEARHGMGAYFGARAALWDDPQLVRDDERAASVVDAMGDANAIVMRGNGVVVAGESLVKAVVLTWYLEDAARIELAVRAAGLQDASVVLTSAERDQRATDVGGIFERMWQHLTAGDPELNLQDESQ